MSRAAASSASREPGGVRGRATERWGGGTRPLVFTLSAPLTSEGLGGAHGGCGCSACASASGSVRAQAALEISQPGDALEQAAEAAADRVMSGQTVSRSLVGAMSGGGAAPTSRRCASCGQAARAEGSGGSLGGAGGSGGALALGSSKGLEARLGAARAGQAEPLPESVRSFMERGFGADFRGVRVHRDGAAQTLARSVSARALTVGGEVFFKHGEFAPETARGRRLIAHELAHVVQQARAPGAAPAVQRAGDPAQAPPTMSCSVATTSPGNVVDEVLFAQNSAVIPAAVIPALEHLAAGWAGAGSPDVRIDGFASEEGTEPHNWDLSCRRAEAVKAVLTGATPGVAASHVRVLAHGESTLAASRPANRRATISLIYPPPTPSPPTPSPPTPTPAPTGPVCGPDVTREVEDAVSRTRTAFAGWSAADRENHCDALDSLRTGGFAWDIVDLHNNAWILGYRPTCASVGATPPCGSTVQVGSECSYAGSPNYVIYGVMCRLCHDHYSATGSTSGVSRFTHAEMQSWINFYKGTGPLGFSTPSGNFVPSTEWATAGYRGWPAATTPRGDRPGCAAACPTPYAGAAFDVAWWGLDPRVRTVI